MVEHLEPLIVDKGPPTTYSFDWIFVKRFCRLFFVFITKENFTTPILFTFLLFMSFLEELVVYNVGMITSAYYKILGDKDLSKFWIQVIKSLLLVTCVAIIKASKEYTSSSLYLAWREALTLKLHKLYFFSDFYYKVCVLDAQRNKLDNPDQRITQDVDAMCQYFSVTLPKLLISPFVIAYYSYNSYQTTGYVGPLGCFVFFLIFTGTSKLLMSPVVNMVYQRQKAEGFFRFQHLHVRTNAEAIAFMDGGRLERKIADNKLHVLLDTQQSLILRQFVLSLAINFQDYAGAIVSFLVLAVPIFAGVYNDLGQSDLSQLISANAFVSMYLISGFTTLVDQADKLSLVAGTAHRIGQFTEDLKERRDSFDGSAENHVSTNSFDGDEGNSCQSGDVLFYNLERISMSEPQGKSQTPPKVLVSELSLRISQGTNVLISGASGSGKTSILRLLRGLWAQTSGDIHRFIPAHTGSNKLVLFLPQRPVLTAGSLRQQLVYPDGVLPFRKSSESEKREDDLATVELKRHLRFVGIESILDRVGGDLDREVKWNWYDALSPGEMQRVSFVRVLYHKPMLAVLDEATSAISFDMENVFYDELRRLNITVLTCGHRESLRDYHDVVLTNRGNANWVLETLQGHSRV